MGYVCAFRGRRDDYQVPAALAEVGALDAFITDHFVGDADRLLSRFLPPAAAAKLLARHSALIPDSSVVRLRSLSLIEALALSARVNPSRAYPFFNSRYGDVAARAARRHGSDLFMYSPHAWEPFTARYRREPRKILFQYHPHGRLQAQILERDRIASARHGVDFAPDEGAQAAQRGADQSREDRAWTLADSIVCASAFSKDSLIAEGADAARIILAPYGIAIPPMPPPSEEKIASRFEALYVGSGVQRKGLHHLLRAWKAARLPRDARLTVVARAIDPALRPMLEATPEIRCLPGVSPQQLNALYATSTLFVLPSLVEGFGQVYLEALSHGLPVLGTRNSACPDLGGERDGVFIAEPGDADDLCAALERLSSALPGDGRIRQAARDCAQTFTWSNFRKRIQSVALAGS
ncbi:MAG: glycosyltransferase family 4 protein [Hyphomicrobium sp.]